MYDSNLAFRNTTDSLTQTETATGIAINGTPAGGLALVIIIPKKSIGDTMQVTLQHSTDDNTYTNLVVDETVASVTEASTVSERRVKRFYTRNKYVRTVTTVAGTSPDFGAVKLLIHDAMLAHTPALGQNL